MIPSPVTEQSILYNSVRLGLSTNPDSCPAGCCWSIRQASSAIGSGASWDNSLCGTIHAHAQTVCAPSAGRRLLLQLPLRRRAEAGVLLALCWGAGAATAAVQGTPCRVRAPPSTGRSAATGAPCQQLLLCAGAAACAGTGTVLLLLLVAWLYERMHLCHVHDGPPAGT